MSTTPKDRKPCLRCSEDGGFTCYPSEGIATCGGEFCATCDYAVPERPGDGEGKRSAPATIPPVSPRARGDLTPQQDRAADKLIADRAKAEGAYREGILLMMDAGASYAAIRAKTGHSTSTLREWKVASGRD